MRSSSTSNSMNLPVIEYYGAAEYMSMKALAEKYGICKDTVRSRVRELEAEIGKRYKRKHIIDDGHIKLINVFVFMDWLANRKMLMNETSRKYVEPFDAAEWAECMGFHFKRVGGGRIEEVKEHVD